MGPLLLRYSEPQAFEEYDVADEMVRFALRHGGMAQLRALVRASGAHRPLAPVLGAPPNRLVAQAWAAYARWFAGHHPPAVYLTPRMWMWSNGGIRWVGQV